MAVIDEYKHNNCRVVVHDDYMLQDPKEISCVIDNVSRIKANELLGKQGEKAKTREGSFDTAEKGCNEHM